ncbi:MAG: hypothetical protein ACRD44_00590 [Bryobacteraceae bacterium]
MEKHVRILGILHIVSGSLWLLAAVILLAIFGGVAGLVGAFADEPDAMVAVPILAIVAAVVTLALVMFSVPSIVAGIGLLNHRYWAKILTIALSVVRLFDVPLGTALGVYGFWVLLTPESDSVFRTPPMQPRAMGA